MSYNEDLPECLLGSIIAAEGIKGSVTILNGPTGCKYYPASLSETICSRSGTFNPYLFMNEFFFCQPRVPCTYLNGSDLILGTDEKLGRIFEIAESSDPELIGLINAPGASLIGSNLDRTSKKNILVVYSESPGYSDPFEKGFQDMVIKILERVVNKKRRAKRASVNIIGISAMQLGWKDSLNYLKELLALCKIDVIATVGAGWSVSDAAASVDASANIMLFENLGNRIAEWYEKNCYIPTIRSPEGLPLGFDQTEAWIVSVCDFLRCDPSPALKVINDDRHRTATEIDRFNRHSGLPAGCTFSVNANSPLAYAVTVMLHSYLGMVPVAVSTTDDTCSELISSYLSENGIEVTDDTFNTPADVFLGNGNIAASLRFRDLIGMSVDIETPGSRDVLICRRPMLGSEGTMYIMDEILNSIDGTTQ